jgi:3-dehydroquinate dehydratase
MGQLGILSRVLSPFFGGKFSYAAIGEKTASGQIHISDFMDIYQMYLKGCEYIT